MREADDLHTPDIASSRSRFGIRIASYVAACHVLHRVIGIWSDFSRGFSRDLRTLNALHGCPCLSLSK